MKFIKVEWYNYLEAGDDHSTTYEIFRSVDKAFKFAESIKVARISLVDMNNTYYEKDLKEWNYEDFNNTIIKDVGI